jgi:hypothetical protein
MAMLVDGTSDRSHVATSLSDAWNSALEGATAKLSSKVDEWTDRLNDVAAGTAKNVSSEIGHQAAKGLDEIADDGSAKQQAVAAGVVAGVRGKNPLWAALKGAWSGGSVTVKAAIVAVVLGVVLLLVLSPVLLLVFLLSILVIAAVAKARSAKH